MADGRSERQQTLAVVVQMECGGRCLIVAGVDWGGCDSVTSVNHAASPATQH